MNPFYNQIHEYCEQYSTLPSDLLLTVEKETWGDPTIDSKMISGKLQGRFLSMVSFLIRPKNILEIGTFTGYSALCLAEYLDDRGRLLSIEKNERLKPTIDGYLSQSDKKAQIEVLFGDALEIIPDLNMEFDLIFIDANKKAYPKYYELALQKLSDKGLILVDNVLWKGQVLEDEKPKFAQWMHEFNALVYEDDRVENLILPLRDGIQMVRKV